MNNKNVKMHRTIFPRVKALSNWRGKNKDRKKPGLTISDDTMNYYLLEGTVRKENKKRKMLENNNNNKNEHLYVL